jgi:hypothetical protein
VFIKKTSISTENANLTAIVDTDNVALNGDIVVQEPITVLWFYPLYRFPNKVKPNLLKSNTNHCKKYPNVPMILIAPTDSAVDSKANVDLVHYFAKQHLFIFLHRKQLDKEFAKLT